MDRHFLPTAAALYLWWLIAVSELFHKFDDRIEAPRIRGCDTSEAAADSIIPHLGAMQQRVYDAILKKGDYGATCQELEDELGLRHENVSARCAELGTRRVKSGEDPLIVDSGQRRKTASGRKARVYVCAKKS